MTQIGQPLDPQTAQKLYEAGFLSQQPNVLAADQSMPEEPINQQPAQVIDQKQIALDMKKKALQKREEQLRAMKIPDEQIAASLAPQRSELDEKERGLILTGERQPEGSLTSDLNQLPGAPQVDLRDQMMSLPAMAGYELQQEAMGMAGQAGAAKALETAAAQTQLQKDLEEQRKRSEFEEFANQNELADKQAELASEVDRVSNLKLDSGKFWADRSTEQKIVLGASLFLGAFGAARGGVNQAATVINNAINQDLEIQKANIAQETAGVEKKRGLLFQMRGRFKDERMAREASRIGYLNDAQLKIQALGNKYDSQIVKANAAKLIGELEVQKQAAQATFMQAFQTTKPVDANSNVADLTKDQRERFVPGYGLALTKDSAVKARESVATIDSIKQNVDELLSLSNKSGSSFSPTDRAKAETITSILTGQLRLPIVGPGAVSEKELELLQRIIADPTKIMSLDANNKERLKTLRQRMDKQTANQLRQFGLQSSESKISFKPLK